MSQTAERVIADDLASFALARGLMPDHRFVRQATETALRAYEAGATVGEACAMGYRIIADR